MERSCALQMFNLDKVNDRLVAAIRKWSYYFPISRNTYFHTLQQRSCQWGFIGGLVCGLRGLLHAQSCPSNDELMSIIVQQVIEGGICAC